MLWFVYNVLFAVGYTLMLPRFLFRMWRRGGYRDGFLERFAVYAPDVAARLAERRRIWIHAVSVGEIQVAFRFMDEMRSRKPDESFVLTTTTSTARAIARKKLSEKDILLCFPADFPAIARRALDRVNPKALILTESEIWPNLIRLAKKRGIPVVLVNGRISDSSQRGYKLLRVFFGEVLRSVDLLLTQTALDEKRLMEFGVERSRVKAMGSAKYDVAAFEPSAADRARKVLEACGMRSSDRVILGGSTWPGEEKTLLDIFKRLKPAFSNLKLVLVPRHAERRVEVEREIEKSQLSFVRRSDLATNAPRNASADVLLVDTTGELMSFYACADVVFVGKSLTSRGGQNVIEPALLAKPVIVGPRVENFAEVVAEFLAAGALLQVQDAAGLEKAIETLLRDDKLRAEYGRRAAKLVADRRGSVKRSVDLITEIMRSTV